MKSWSQVFDQALQGGGAKSINFQDLAADLAQITFDYPFQIPPYFALIIRAISVLEGIALKANPEFAIVDEAYPYIAQRLLVDNSPRLREALRYMVRCFHPFVTASCLQVLQVFYMGALIRQWTATISPPAWCMRVMKVMSGHQGCQSL